MTAYEKALSLAEDDEQRSHVYAAMGMLAFSVNDLEGAKTSLFNWYIHTTYIIQLLIIRYIN